jgi:hypothetical protein
MFELFICIFKRISTTNINIRTGLFSDDIFILLARFPFYKIKKGAEAPLKLFG